MTMQVNRKGTVGFRYPQQS